MERILREGEKALRLGLEEKDMSVVSLEIGEVGPKRTSSTPDVLRGFFSMYLSTVLEQVQRWDGVVDSFAGDNIMAYWGHDNLSGHAERACRAAIDLRFSLALVLDKFRGRLESVSSHIGISTGIVHVGNIGTERRIRHGVVGAIVNEAAELSWLARACGKGIVISTPTSQGLSPALIARTLMFIHRGEALCELQS